MRDRREFSLDYKRYIVTEYDLASPDGKRALLDREGLRSYYIRRWRHISPPPMQVSRLRQQTREALQNKVDEPLVKSPTTGHALSKDHNGHFVLVITSRQGTIILRDDDGNLYQAQPLDL